MTTSAQDYARGRANGLAGANFDGTASAQYGLGYAAGVGIRDERLARETAAAIAGIPAGGDSGTVLSKASETDFDFEWTVAGQPSTTPVWRSVTLQPANILALDTTPFVLVPAPGGRKYVAIITALMHLRFVSTPFTGTTGYLVVGWANPGDDLTTAPSACALAAGVYLDRFWHGTEDHYFYFQSDNNGIAVNSSEGPLTKHEDVDVSLWTTGNTLADGNSTLTVRVLYSVINGAPAV